MSETTRIAVVGGGVSGLALGYALRERTRAAGANASVTVLEAEPHAGGHATTLREDGFVVELGPNAFLDRPAEPQTRALVAALGLDDRQVAASPSSRTRYIWFDGRLRRAPAGPPSLIASELLSVGARLRLLREPFVRPAPAGAEESVYDFARRRLGREVAERLIDPAIAGISAGDSRQLAVAAAFPALVEMERSHGSLVRALIAQRPGRPTLRSFAGGMGTLTETLAARLGSALRCEARVASVAPAGGGWRVQLASGEALAFDRVALGVAANAAAALVRDFDDALAAPLAEIPFAGLAMVALAYRESDLPRPLDGYGYLVAGDAGLDTLGVVWESSLFPNRAPAGMVLLRAMLGGARRPEVADLPESDLVERARRELARVMGIRAMPARQWVRSWPRAIAQYTAGHLARVARARALAAGHGLELFGTSYDGISFTAAIASAQCAADRLLGTPRTTNVASSPGARPNEAERVA